MKYKLITILNYTYFKLVSINEEKDAVNCELYSKSKANFDYLQFFHFNENVIIL